MSFQKGEPIEIYAIGQDATEKVMAEKRLIISLLQTRQIFESMTNAFISVDKNWCFTKVNKPFEKMGKQTFNQVKDKRNNEKKRVNDEGKR